MNNDRIAAIRERCEAIQIITPNQARKDLIQAKKDMAALLTEIDRLNAELFGKTEQLEAAKSELLQKMQQLEAYTSIGLTPDEFKQSVDYVLELNKKCKESTGCTAEEIASLRVALAASQRREQAAADAVNRMAEYIVTKGRVDDMLCDDIPQKLHLKHQPKNDGNYDNGPCIKCVAEYFMSGPQEGGE